jgi:hypothetical protein
MTFYDELGQSFEVDLSDAAMVPVDFPDDDVDFSAMLDRLLADIMGESQPLMAANPEYGDLFPVLCALEDATPDRYDAIASLFGLTSELVGERYSVAEYLGGAIELRIVPFDDGTYGWFATDKATNGRQFLMISAHADYRGPFEAINPAVAAIEEFVNANSLHVD